MQPSDLVFLCSVCKNRLDVMNQPLHILHLEDDPADAELIASALESGGLSCKTARVETREEFTAATLVADRYDLILSDYVLPSFDGMAALSIALDNCPDVPFILLSGVLGEEVAIDAMKQGATDYVLKDRLERLVPAVSRAVREAEERRRLRIAEEESEAMRMQLQQAQKMEAIGTLAGGVAHDFNNLLTSILGFSRLALQALKDDDSARSDIEEVIRAGESAARLTRQLLSFSKKQLLQMEPMEPNNTIRNIEELLRRTIGEDVDLVIELCEVPIVLKADVGQFEQVLLNLIVNSRDAMPDGGRIEIRTDVVTLDNEFCKLHKQFSPGNCFHLSVSDTGPGIPEEIRDSVFDPFFTTKELGTGLGLSMVYGIIDRFGGCVVIGEGAGAEFDIYLPRVEDHLPPAAVEVKAPVETGNEKILVVEDETSVRRVAKRLLESAGYTVVDTGSPLEAIRIFEARKSSFDLVMTDMVMPEMTGIELAERLDQLRPGIKILYASGYVDDRIDDTLLSADGAELILKPYTYDSLTRRVREILISA